MKDTASDEKGLPAGIKMMAVFIVIIIIMILMTAFFYMRFKKLHDPSYLLDEARAAYDLKNYDAAEELIDEVLALTPDDRDAVRLKADILMDAGRLEEAGVIYEKLLKDDPGELVYWQALMAIREAKGDTQAMEELLLSAPDDIRSEFPGYLPSEPAIMTEGGSYSNPISVEISGDPADTIRYTEDGTDPDETSSVYSEPISLGEGRSEIRAAAFSSKGIMSRVVTAIYEITIPLPDPPEILPDSGAYPSGTVISVTLPADAEVRYAFDAVPTPESALYSGAVPMPEGTHIFSAIIIDAAGKVSAPSSQTYVVR